MRYTCKVCGWSYDEAEGDLNHGILPGTEWSDIPGYFECPLCAMGKDVFRKVE